jgi:sugar phosphate isomerase/epimerase
MLARAGMCQSTTAPWHFDEDARRYSAAGWGAIGVWLQKLADGPMHEMKLPAPIPSNVHVDQATAAVRAAGLHVSHLIASGFYTEPDEEARLRSIDHTLSALAVAERLETQCLVVVPGRLNGLRRKRALDLSAASLMRVIERSSGSTVRLAIEPVTELDFANTLDEALDLADLVDDPRVGVFVDSFHVLRKPDVAEAVERASGRILGVHLVDAHPDGTWKRSVPGEGRLDLADFVGRIEATGYRGTYDVELVSIGASDAEAADLLSRCTTGMRSLVDQLALAGVKSSKALR